MVVPKIYEIISFKKSKWLENLINFKTQKRNLATNDFKKDFYILLNQAFYGKALENVKNRVKKEFLKKEDNDQFKQQSKIAFNGFHKSSTNYDIYSFKESKVLLDQLTYLGLAK